MQDLSLQTGIELEPPASTGQSCSHQTTWEILLMYALSFILLYFLALLT